jgi:hypothetical protein
MGATPNTLPADFFQKNKSKSLTAPDTLPADFFVNQPGIGFGGVSGAGEANPLVEEQRVQLGKKLLDFAQEEGPAIAGMMIGGAFGTPGGPPGMIAGAAIGGAAGEAAGQLTRRAGAPVGREVETSAEAASEIGFAGVAGGAGELGGAALNRFVFKPILSRLFGRTITPELRAASEFRIPVIAGDVSPGTTRQAVEGFIGQTILGKTAFRRFRLEKQLPEVNRTIDEFVRGVSRVDLPPEQSGELLVSFLNKARERVGANFDDAVRAIAREAPDAAIRGKSALSETAGTMLGKLRSSTDEFSSLLGVEDLNRAMSILKDFAKTGERVETGVLSAAGKPITRFQPRVIPVEKAIELRKLLFSISQASETTIGKGTIKKLNQALTESIGEALQRAGRPDLNAEFLKVSRNFRFVVENLEKRSLKGILNQESPEVIVDLLLRRGSATRLKRIESVLSAVKIPLSKLNPIRASAIRRIFDQSTREIPISNTINAIERRIGTDTLRKLFGGAEPLQRFRRFSGLLDSIGFNPQLISPQAGGAGIGLAVGGVAGGLTRAVAGAPSAAVQGLAFGTGVVGLPGVIGRWLTNPKRLLTVEKVVFEELRRNGRAAAVARLMGFVTASGVKRLEPRFPGFPVLRRGR